VVITLEIPDVSLQWRVSVNTHIATSTELLTVTEMVESVTVHERSFTNCHYFTIVVVDKYVITRMAFRTCLTMLDDTPV